MGGGQIKSTAPHCVCTAGGLFQTSLTSPGSLTVALSVSLAQSTIPDSHGVNGQRQRRRAPQHQSHVSIVAKDVVLDISDLEVNNSPQLTHVTEVSRFSANSLAVRHKFDKVKRYGVERGTQGQRDGRYNQNRHKPIDSALSRPLQELTPLYTSPPAVRHKFDKVKPYLGERCAQYQGSMGDIQRIKSTA